MFEICIFTSGVTEKAGFSLENRPEWAAWIAPHAAWSHRDEIIAGFSLEKQLTRATFQLHDVMRAGAWTYESGSIE